MHPARGDGPPLLVKAPSRHGVEALPQAWEPVLDEHALGKLRWRCRRGLLENDLFIERFFGRHGATLTARQGQALEHLMRLADNDLLDLLLRRRQPEGELAYSDVTEVLEMLRN